MLFSYFFALNSDQLNLKTYFGQIHIETHFRLQTFDFNNLLPKEMNNIEQHQVSTGFFESPNWINGPNNPFII